MLLIYFRNGVYGMKKLFLLVVFSFQIGSVLFAQVLAPEPNSYSSYAVDTSGYLYAWGYNGQGQLGVGNSIDTTLPIIVYFPGGLISCKAISGGFEFCLAIGGNGNLYAWGQNSHGQLGTGDTTERYFPVKIDFPAGVTKWIAVAAGMYHSLAIGDNGNLYTCGINSDGELGFGDTASRNALTLVPFPDGVTGWKSVAAGAYHSLAIGNDNNIYSWGQNGWAQLGIGSVDEQFAPAQVPLPKGVTGWKIVAAGGHHSLAIGNNGNLYTWGDNDNVQLGLGDRTYGWTPNLVSLPNGVTGWKTVAAGQSHSLAISNDGGLYAWGFNAWGQLGLGQLDVTDDQNMPVFVPFPDGVTGWKSVSAGAYHSLAIGSDGNLYAWGDNGLGQLGLGRIVFGTDTYLTVPSLVFHLGSITGVSKNELTIPRNYSLSQNYPNPFNPSTTIEYSIPKSSFVSLKVYDVLGREVVTLVDEEKSQGNYLVVFNAKGLSSGIYFYRMQAENFVEIKKLILMK